ncbi:MAG: histidine phosphatase family protein [Chloroflexi bacterium]|nr:histidine phosphatase family protein [Chloroflexota bacterium]
MTTLILVRHGETEANVRQVWQGSLDAPLTARGQEQVQATAQYMAELDAQYPIDAFYVSPLARAQSTASAIAQNIHLNPTIEHDLREFDLGDWEGRSFLDLKEKENLWERWRVEPSFTPPNGESPYSFNRRAVAIFEHLAILHPEKTVLVVTHGGLICNLLATWFGTGPGDWMRWEPHNCAISIVQVEAGQRQAVVVNSIVHLPAQAIIQNDNSIYATEVSEQAEK